MMRCCAVISFSCIAPHLHIIFHLQFTRIYEEDCSAKIKHKFTLWHKFIIVEEIYSSRDANLGWMKSSYMQKLWLRKLLYFNSNPIRISFPVQPHFILQEKHILEKTNKTISSQVQQRFALQGDHYAGYYSFIQNRQMVNDDDGLAALVGVVVDEEIHRWWYKFKLEATTTQTASQTIEKQQNENILKNDAFEMIPIALVRCFNHPCLGYNDDWNNTLTNGCMEKKQ